MAVKPYPFLHLLLCLKGSPCLLKNLPTRKKASKAETPKPLYYVALPEFQLLIAMPYVGDRGE